MTTIPITNYQPIINKRGEFIDDIEGIDTHPNLTQFICPCHDKILTSRGV